MSTILDSGERRNFDTGAVRDIAEGKGRCDLLPLKVVARLIQSQTLMDINDYLWEDDPEHLEQAIYSFIQEHKEWKDSYTAMLEVAKQYEDGIVKYGERNWEKGIPIHCFIDSGVRHYLKYRRGDSDERHDRAFLWNMLGALWTHRNKPELIDTPFQTMLRKEDIK
jgi:hypothetical protein